MTMLSLHHTDRVKIIISKIQKGRKHKLHEGFQKGHTFWNHPNAIKTQFKKGQAPWIKGRGVGVDKDKLAYRIYRVNAKRKSFDYKLTLKEFKEFRQSKCHYCGEQAIGIDRKDSLKGYVKGNMLPCCQMCNRMKNNYSYNDFLKKCKQIVQAVGYEI